MRFSRLSVVAAAALFALVAPAHAEAPDAGPPADGYEDDADRGLLECPADRIQARKAHEAALAGARRLFVTVTGETVNLAQLQASAWFDQAEYAFVAPALVRVREALVPLAVAARISQPPPEDLAPKRGRLSGAACRAMAGREDAACAALDPVEQQPCLDWLAIWRATRGGVEGCAALGGTAAKLCRAVWTGDVADCGGLTGEARAGCDEAVAALAAADAHCGAALDASRCGWALLARGLRADRAACDAAAPSPTRGTAEHQRTHQLCQAVLGGEAHRCPADGLYARRTLPAPAEVAVVGSLTGPWAVVVVASPTPAICHLEVTVRSAGAVRPFIAIVRQGSWAPTVWRLPLPLSVDSFSATATVSALCAPSAPW
ncbi:MAG: hypothetical protein R3F39_13140 [Myxococcota bacterium]